MKFMHFVGAFTALVSATSAFAASDVFADQINASFSPVEVTQMVSLDNLASMASEGSALITTLRNDLGLTATSNSAALLVQTGEGHLASINQTGTGHLGAIMQSGYLNSASLTQTGVNNSALIMQSGYGHLASVTQSGANHSAMVMQQGRNNVAIISQR